MSRQVGSLHRSISHPANLPIIPLFALPPPQSPHHNISSSMEPDTNSNTTVYNTISQFNNSDIETPDAFANSEPSPSSFSQPPFQPIQSQVKIEPPSPHFPISYVTPIYSPLTSEPSHNNHQDHTQISQELDKFIKLQQQLQHPQTLSIHQLSRSITSSNSSIPTPSSNYTQSQNLTSSSTPSSSAKCAYRNFKRKLPNIPFPNNPGTSTTFVNHPLHINTKEFLETCLPFFHNTHTSIQTPMMRNPII